MLHPCYYSGPTVWLNASGGGRALLALLGDALLRLLVARYLDDPSSSFARWLLDRVDRETAISIEPSSLVSWDFRKRMGSAA